MHEVVLPAVIALCASLILTPIMIVAARYFGVVDVPGGRRIHSRITPRLGGVAILLAFFVSLWLFLPEIAPNFKDKQLLGFMAASTLLLVIGIADDKWGVPAIWQFLSQVVAGVTLVLVGMGIEEVTSPFGGKLDLHVWDISIALGGVPHFLALPADLITVAWVVLVINAVNWIDGLDGLAGGVGLISAITLALLSLSATVDQPHVATLAMILAGAIAGFLVYNFNPAKIFLGTVGSTFIGFSIATLAIISGGKIATAVLVLGFPILDALSLVIRRSLTGQAAWQPGTDHLHHLLLARGWSVRRTVLSIYLLCASFGALALLAGTTQLKAVSFGLLAVLMVGVLIWASRPVTADD